MKFTKLHPDKGYRGDYLWLPRKHIKNLGGVQRSLTFHLEEKAPIYAWGATKHHLMVPRALMSFEEIEELPYEVVNLFPLLYPQLPKIGLTYEPRDELQSIGIDVLSKGSGILSLAPGKGKTVCALHAWSQLRVPMLIVVNTEDLMRQWRNRIAEHTSLKAADVGWIKSDKWDWEGKPIAVATVQTLASRWTEISEECRRYWGIVCYDETHILGGPHFNLAAPLGYGLRWGLSATPHRSDGLENLYIFHIGPILYQNLEHDITPTCYFVSTGIEMTDADKKKVRGQDAYLRNWLAEHPERNKLIREWEDDALGEGRTIINFSDRLVQLESFHSTYKGSGLITGKVTGANREKALQKHNPIFALTKIARDGLDRATLDTAFFMLPFRDPYRLYQATGRILRELDNKLEPIVVIFYDSKIPMAQRQCRALMAHLTELKYPYRIVR